MARDERLVVVSNRLPVTGALEGGKWTFTGSVGGLATALAAALRGRGGLWIGWPGTPEDVDVDLPLREVSAKAGYELQPVTLTGEERDRFYFGFSNEVIWPLFHDLQTYCNFKPEYWTTYEQVNSKFAHAILGSQRPGDDLWVHDYHLMGVAKELRALGVRSRIGFFLHIPFPPLDIFLKLPWRFEILRALLHFDLLGFQTPRDLRNFLQVATAMLRDATVEGEGRLVRVHAGGRRVRVGVFPIGVDFREFVDRASSREVRERAQWLRQRLPERHFILGVDRLDYTKGIPLKLEAFHKALERHPEMWGKVSLIQVLSPSREGIPQYEQLKSEVERMVGAINGTFTQHGWVPIHYIHRNLDLADLLAYYVASEVAFITPLKDGMNLVAKEYCATRVRDDGVLILSEFAGSAAQLQEGAILVNPYDTDMTAEALYQAFTMPAEEQRARMKRMRATTQQQDIFWWVESFLQASTASLGDAPFPPMEDYVPQTAVERP